MRHLNCGRKKDSVLGEGAIQSAMAAPAPAPVLCIDVAYIYIQSYTVGENWE